MRLYLRLILGNCSFIRIFATEKQTKNLYNLMFRLRIQILMSLLALVCNSMQAQEPPHINLLFIGNSITAGATLSNAAQQAPPIVCRALVEEATGVTTNVYNGGHSGITTFGYLPGRDDFTSILNNAKNFQKNGGKIYISIMLGTNDSACSGPEGAPVNPDVYANNIRTIIDKLIENDFYVIINWNPARSKTDPKTNEAIELFKTIVLCVFSFFPLSVKGILILFIVFICIGEQFSSSCSIIGISIFKL